MPSGCVNRRICRASTHTLDLILSSIVCVCTVVYTTYTPRWHHTFIEKLPRICYQTQVWPKRPAIFFFNFFKGKNKFFIWFKNKINVCRTSLKHFEYDVNEQNLKVEIEKKMSEKFLTSSSSFEKTKMISVLRNSSFREFFFFSFP
jgi:hypothetical protein